MDFSLPADLVSYLARLDAFIAAEIAPLQAQNDNQRFFDHRREWARTDFEGGGLPRREWEELLARSAAARRPRRLLPLLAAARVRRRRRLESVDGGDSRASRGAGSRAAQRSAERAFGGRQLSVHRDDARLRQRRAEGAVHPRQPRRQSHRRVRPDRAAARLGRDAHGDACRAREARRRRRLAHRRREDVDDRHARRDSLRRVRAHERRSRAARKASARSSCRARRPA